MRDAVATIIQNYDRVGRYLDPNAIAGLKSYFDSGAVRIQAVRAINLNAADIVKSAAAQLFTDVPDLLRPGGNAYTTRRYAACLRDMDYFLRYASYALVAGSFDVLDERVLAGLRETYNSLGVPPGPIVQSIERMKDEVLNLLEDGADSSLVTAPFEYMAAQLSETNI
ncbi:allophycocyanin subunit beta [Synechococcus sp. PCC 7336]|uniref:allophycocyanin subunit beta n=1 Tax=Synechococcus sp. PCC 7336 TaxID=195250 RepID=UPI0003464880|nr:allophycocyanin subunit beta [Synechococcus sp. PCC 7336]